MSNRIKIIYFILAFGLWYQNGPNLYAQCSFTGPEIIAPSTSRFFNLEIQGALNNDLSNPNQGICGVIIDFQHPLIGDLSIRLISPANDTITLIGPLGITNFTNNTRWNVSFFPCAQATDPDPGFAPVWSNLQDWGQFGYFEGAYHPALGCLENFNTGSVNGVWQLEFINNYPFDVPVNSAILHSFTILFCDPSGLDCEICLAKGGTLVAPNGEFCSGEDRLLLEIEEVIVGVTPPDSLYGYTYMIGSGGTLINTLSQPDLRNFLPGTYQVCGLSYLIRDENQLPQAGSPLSFSQFRNQLRSNTPPFCGSLSSTCLEIIILPNADTTFISAAICRDEPYIIDSDTLFDEGIHYIQRTAANGCDSILAVRLAFRDWTIDKGFIPQLNCGDSVLLWFDQMQFSEEPDSILFRWYEPNGAQLPGQLQEIWVRGSGSYECEIVLYWGESFCSTVIEFTVQAADDQLSPSFEYRDSLCAGSLIRIETNDAGSGPYRWYSPDSDLIIEGFDTLDAVTIRILQGSTVSLCLEYFDSCTNMYSDTCVQLTAIDFVAPDVLSETVFCNQEGEIFLSGFSQTPEFTLLNGPGLLSINYQDPDYIQFGVSIPGSYAFLLSQDGGNCLFLYPLMVEILPLALPSVIQYDLLLCDPNPLRLLLDFPVGYVYQVFINIGGQIFQFQINGGSSEFIEIPYEFIELPIELIRYELRDYPECGFDDNFPLDLTLLGAPEFDVPELITLCNAADGTLGTVWDASLAFGSSTPGVQIDDLDQSGATGFPLMDFEGVLAGTYRFEYAYVFSALCPAKRGEFVIEVEECQCPDLLSRFDTLTCELEVLDLSVYELVQGGVWNTDQFPLGAELNLVGKRVDFITVNPGLYRFRYQVSTLPDNCIDSAFFELEVLPTFIPGALTRDTVYSCVGLDTFWQLEDFRTGITEGVWEYIGGNTLPSGSFDGTTGRLINRLLSAGTYQFRFSAPDTVPCSDSTLILTIILENKSFEDLVADIQIGCNTPYAEFNIRLDTAEFIVFWTVLVGDYFVQDPNTFELIIDREGVFELTVINTRNLCRNREIFTISTFENQITGADIEVSSPLCPADSFGSINIRSVTGGRAPLVYSIGSGFTSSTRFESLTPSNYVVEIVDDRGCRYRDTVEVINPQSYRLEIQGEQLFAFGQEGRFNFISTIPISSLDQIRWFADGALVCSGCTDWTERVEEDFELILQIEDPNGCLYADTLFVRVSRDAVFFVPDAFTPNGDGLNDQWLIYSPDPGLLIHQLMVFDRWGAKVYTRNDFYPATSFDGWDGTYRNQLLQPGSFIYFLEYSRGDGEKKLRKGEVFLAR